MQFIKKIIIKKRSSNSQPFIIKEKVKWSAIDS